MTFVLHSWFLTGRLLRHMIRQPWYIVFTLIQPLLWLLLYGQLFQQIASLGGFGGVSYITFLTPGIVVMSALASSGWTGMSILADMDSGVLDRLLVSPASRAAIICSRLVGLAANISMQFAALVSVGLLLGARYSGGALGFVVLLFAAVFLGTAFGALSIALVLVLRKQESVVSIINVILLPLMFLSPTLLARDLMPAWMQRLMLLNPLAWAVEAARGALTSQADWATVAVRLIALCVFAMVSYLLARLGAQAYLGSL